MPSVLDPLPISPASKLFLAQIGLPASIINTDIDFNPHSLINLTQELEEGRQADDYAYTETVRRLQRVPDLTRYSLRLHDIDVGQFWRLGDDATRVLSIEAYTDRIYFVDLSGNSQGSYEPPLFLNSNIAAFGQFTYLWLDSYEWIYEREKKMTYQEMKQVEALMREIDPAAMEEDDSYWPNTVEELYVEFDEYYEGLDNE